MDRGDGLDDEQYPMSEAHDTGEEPVLTGVRFVCPSSSLIVKQVSL